MIVIKRRWRHKYANSVSPKLSHWIIVDFHSIIGLHSSFFSTGFFKGYT
jgi:hypothetical protein